MASVVRLSRRVSSFVRHSCGVTRSYNSWHSNSEVKRWGLNTGLFATVSITLYCGYRYFRSDAVHAKVRKVCKYTFSFYYFVQLIIYASLNDARVVRNTKVVNLNNESSVERNLFIGIDNVFELDFNILLLDTPR